MAPYRLPDEVVSPRLRLRRWRPEDAPLLAAAVTASLDHLRPWMGWVAREPLTVEQRAEMLASREGEWAAGGDAMYGVFRGHEVVGGCGLHHRIGPGGLEIGYWIHVDHVRRGYATELTRALTSAAFELPGIERVEIHHDKANAASGAVPRALGYERGPERPDEVEAPAEVGVDCTWTMTRSRWSRRAASPMGRTGPGR